MTHETTAIAFVCGNSKSTPPWRAADGATAISALFIDKKNSYIQEEVASPMLLCRSPLPLGLFSPPNTINSNHEIGVLGTTTTLELHRGNG